MFTDPENAGSELRSVLPPELTAHIDFNDMVLQEGTFVDENLRHRQTDVLFKTTVQEDDAYVYVVIEHQSTPDPLMAFRMLQYQVRIWDRHVKQHTIRPGQRPLPLIIPVVIYQGRRRWTAPTDIADLLDINDSLGAAADGLIPHASYLLDDLTTVSDAALRARPLTTAARITFVFLTKAPEDPNAIRWLPEWTDHINQLDSSRLEALFQYLVVVSTTQVEDIIRYTATVGPEAEEAAMNTADVLRAEGRAEGRAGALAEGRAGLLIELLTAKFGDVDTDTRERVARANTEQISQWSARLVLGADTLEQIFAPEG
ncbi:Rpn family recombination-promoting nuclease/putative transposase [Gordonia amarae]|uniref:Rpn family recombination-promoting nuclease/putative transposase n=1 Tax=Gordonia amarae TaxID=36821 RepID=UPI001FCAFF80|nr:Rpn family recombination-promoting nuclease/putative transposase [Gordonia amarae]